MGTVRVKPWGQGQGDYVVIEESDFDPKVHMPFEEPPPLPAPSPTPEPPPKAKAKP